MSDLQEYDRPFPKPDSVVATGSGRGICSDSPFGYGCTREPGHAGDHQACGVDDLMRASWAPTEPRDAS